MAEANFRLPPELNLSTGNIADNFRKWRRQLEVYLEASGGSAKPNKTQTAIILHCAGPQALEVYDQFQFEDDSHRTDPDKVLEKLHDYCNPRSSEVLETYRFWNTATIEPFDAFITELRTKADKCNFLEKDRMIRDKIVFSAEKKLQEKLLREQDLSLSKAIAIGQSFEQTNNQLQEMNTQIDKVQRSISDKQRSARKDHSRQNDSRRQKKTHMLDNCNFCGKSHEQAKEKCPAWGQTCSNCHRRNHFAVKCKNKAIKFTTEEEESSSDEWLLAVNAKKERMTALLTVNDNSVRFQVDTGADVNIICKKHVRREQTKATSQTLTMWNNTKMKPVGEAVLQVTNPKTKEQKDVRFTVVGNNFTCLIGLKTSRDLSLITVNEDKFIARVETDAIGDLGVATLTVDPTIKPTILPCRKIPHALKDKVREEIDSLLQRGIMEKVEEPTPWVNQMVVVPKKNGEIRICIDPKPLNKALQREHFKLPTLDDILPEIQDAKVFTKLDIKDAYWHVRLDEDSSKLTTMITPFGFRVRWTRLPFGLCVSSEIFQRKLSEALQGLPGCLNVADDIVVAGRGSTRDKADKDHEKNLSNLKQRCQERNIKLNEKKAVVKQSEITFMGHRISDKGIAPTSEKVQAILNLQPPTDVSGVRRLCGMVQYLSRYLSNLSDILSPISKLTKKDTPFSWTNECQIAFQAIKDKISTAPVLTHFDPHKTVEVEVDSSKEAIGAVLLQEGQPLEFASRKLTDTEKRWAQIEKEMMAVVFGLEKFDQYTYGRKVIVINDHKPLTQILQKPLSQTPMRLQKLIMRSHRYDFDFKWTHGSHIPIADYLSRNCFDPQPQPVDDDDLTCRQINSNIPDVLIDRVRNCTNEDATLSLLSQTIQNGWPEHSAKLPPTLLPFFNLRDTLSIEDGIIMKGERIFIPKAMRQEIKEKLHSAHLAYDSMMRRARQTVFWPGMSAEIKMMADACQSCQNLKPANQKETLLQHDTGGGPWEKVACDIMEIQGRHYLVTVDYFSNFIEADYLHSTTADTVITKLKGHFARFGVPKSVMSDNGPQFSGKEFLKFAQRWGFQHITSSPGHPRSNGRAEAAVKIIKHMMKKANHDKQDQYEALLELRNTPRQSNKSPAELMLARRARTLVPTMAPNKPTEMTNNGNDKQEKRQQSIKNSYNKQSEDLPPLQPRQPVYYRNPGQTTGWNKGRIIESKDRRYTIEGENGGIYQRNRVLLRPKFTPFKVDEDYEYDHVENDSTNHDHTDSDKLHSSYSHPRVTTSDSHTTPNGDTLSEAVCPSPNPGSRPKRNTYQPAWMKDFVLSK